jgi:hypothetical protein
VIDEPSLLTESKPSIACIYIHTTLLPPVVLRSPDPPDAKLMPPVLVSRLNLLAIAFFRERKGGGLSSNPSC